MQLTPNQHKFKTLFCLGLVGLLTFAGSATYLLTHGTKVLAAACEWTGNAGNPLWSDPANWNFCSGSVPNPGDSLTFPATASSFNSTNDLGTFTVGQMDIQAAYNFNGNSIVPGGNINISGDTDFAFNSIDNSGAYTITVDSTYQLTLEANVDTGSLGTDLTLNVNGALVMNGSFAFTGSGNIVKDGTGYLQMGGSGSDYTGTTTVNGGHLQISNANSLGSAAGGTILNNGVIELTAGTTWFEPFTVNGGSFESFNDGADLAGTITLDGPTLFSGDVNKLTISGTITGTASVTFRGTMVITGTNDYTGDTAIQYQQTDLTFSGTQSASTIYGLVSNTLLHGAGSIGPVNLNGDSSGLSGSDDFYNPSLLTINGDLTMDGNSKLSSDIYGPTTSDYDRIAVNGGVTLTNATLSFNLGYTATVGDTYTLIDNDGSDPISGTFTGNPDGSAFSAGINGNFFAVNYEGGDGNDLVVTAINPPAPTINALTATSPINENGTTNLHLSFSDILVNDNYVVHVDWGDGSSHDYNLTTNELTLDTSHLYKNDGSFHVAVSITDDYSLTTNDSKTVVVNNVAPTLSVLTISGAGASKVLTAVITDPGTLDTFVVSINWQDGTAVQTLNLAAGSTSLSASHTITGTGNFNTSITITDSSNGSNSYNLIANVPGGSIPQTPLPPPPPGAPEVVMFDVSVLNGATTTDTTPEFSWQFPSDLSVDHITLYLAQISDANGEQLIDSSTLTPALIATDPYLYQNLTDGTLTKFTPVTELNSGGYEWVVVAYNADDQKLAQSNIAQFTVSGGNSPTPPPVTPTSSGTQSTRKILGLIPVTPEANDTIQRTTVVPATAAVLGTATVAIVSSGNVFGVVTGIFLPRRRKYWGIVYDPIMDKPIGFSNLTLHDVNDHIVVTQAVSDQNGKYGMLVNAPGRYLLKTNASGYLTSETEVQIDDVKTVAIDVPLIPTESPKNKLLKFIHDHRGQVLDVLRIALSVSMAIGFIYTLVALSLSPVITNWILLIIYGVLTVPGILIILESLRNLVKGNVIDSNTHHGIAGATVHLIGQNNQSIVALTTSSGEIKVNLQPGKYTAIVYKNGYKLKGSKANNQIEVEISSTGELKHPIELIPQVHSPKETEQSTNLSTPFGN